MNHPIDKSGVRIEPGDRIAYGRALGRCAALGLARVVSTEWVKGGWKITIQADDRSKPSILRFPDRIVVIG